MLLCLVTLISGVGPATDLHRLMNVGRAKLQRSFLYSLHRHAQSKVMAHDVIRSVLRASLACAVDDSCAHDSMSFHLHLYARHSLVHYKFGKMPVV